MDRTTIVNASTFGVYRKCEMDGAKQQSDSSLCDDIHSNMQMLAFFHPFSDGLKENFEIGMFIKSNTKAFPHVMKYLFTILDPIEFKKKFCWPLYNKAAEATFRNSSLEFLIKLNAKYKLNFGELKNKIVVFPGGTDFMRIVIELTKMAMRITLKRNGVDASATNQMSICNATATKKLRDIQMLYDNVMIYTEQLNTQSSKLKEKTIGIRMHIEHLTEGTNISTTDIFQRGLSANWQETQNQIIENGIKPQMQRLKVFHVNCERLENKINAMVKKQPIKYNAESFHEFIDGMRKLYPIHFRQLSNCANQHYINMNNLLLAFRLALPLILSDAQTYTPPSIDVIGYEAKGVEKMVTHVNNIVHKTAMFEKQFNQIIGDANGRAKDKLNNMKNTNHMKLMIFATPSISLNVIKQRGKNTKRISLMKENFSNRKISTFNASLRPIRSMSIDEVPNTNSRIFTSPIRGRSNTTSKLNPMHMLRTIEKKNCHQSHHLRRIELQKFNAHPAKEQYTLPTFTSINEHDLPSSHIDRSQNDNNSQSLVFLPSPTPQHTSLSIQNQLSPFQSAMRKQQHTDINRSPSGRLETFLNGTERNADLSNNLNVSKEIAMKKINSSPMNVSTSTQIGFSKPLGMPIEEANVNHSNIENNLNANNTNKFTLFQLINENDESLFNTSDTILTSANDCSRIELPELHGLHQKQIPSP